MLAATHRLRRSGDFTTAVRGGRRAGRGTLVVHLLLPDPNVDTPADTPSLTDIDPRRQPAPASTAARAGFVVSRAVGGAVVRNTVRRRLRHLTADRLDALPPGAVLVVRALPGAATASYQRLGADLDAALSAARRPRRG